MLKFNQEKKDFDETIEDLNTSYVKVQYRCKNRNSNKKRI